MKRSSQASSKLKARQLPEPDASCPHATEELIDLKSMRWDGQGLFLCPHCKTPSGVKLLVVRENPKWKAYLSSKATLDRFDSLFG